MNTVGDRLKQSAFGKPKLREESAREANVLEKTKKPRNKEIKKPLNQETFKPLFEGLDEETFKGRFETTNLEINPSLLEVLEDYIYLVSKREGKKVTRKQIYNRALNDYLKKEFKKLEREE